MNTINHKEIMDKIPEDTRIKDTRINEEAQAIIESLRTAAEPLLQWLRRNGNPHSTILMDQTHVELVDGRCSAPFNPPD